MFSQQPTKEQLGDRLWWRRQSMSLAWFNANVMPHGWDEKFQDFGMINQAMCDHLDPTTNPSSKIYMSAFRGSHKTTMLLGYICWFFCWNLVKKNTNALVYNTATKENTYNMSADAKHSLLHNEMLHWVFPELPTEEGKYDDMTKQRIQHRHVKLDFTSLETTLVSRHYKTHINDDWENDENARSEHMREELKRRWKYQKAILTKIKSRGIGVEIEVGTPFHTHGLTWYIRNLPSYSVLEIPCYIDCDKRKGVTFPELFSVEDFEDKLHDMSSTIFSSQYLLKPLSEENALCPEGWVRYWTRLPGNRWRTMVIDPALSANPGDDATGITVCDTDENGTLYLVHADEYFLSPEKLLECIVSLKRQFDPDDIRIEKEKYSTTIADIWEHRYPDLNISYVLHKGRAKGSKKNRDEFNTRIWRLRQWFETHRILLGPNMKAFEKQLIEYPDSTRDDMLDSLAYQLDIRRIPKRRDKMILPSGKEFEPSVEESFEREFEQVLERKRMREEERFADAYF